MEIIFYENFFLGIGIFLAGYPVNFTNYYSHKIIKKVIKDDRCY